METLRNGKFSITLNSHELSRGLRKKQNNPRDVHAMTSLSGMVGQDGVLSSVEQLSRIDTSVITDPFPYPQLFILVNHIIVCSSTKIYEYVNNSLIEKITVPAALTWKVVDYIEFLLFSNGDKVITRNARNGYYQIASDIPEANALCNYNGQLLIGGFV